MFWWWQYNYRSYAESVIFDEPIFATGVRILMKDPVFYYFGIYQVKVVTKKWLVQLKSGQNTDSDECLNLNNGVASYGQEITVRNCIEAIEQGDARELFILQNNMQITSYNENFCIESSDGVIEETSHIHLQNCRLIISSTNDGREKWLLDTKGFMKIYKNTNKCLTIKGNEIELQTLSSTVVSVSSVMNDGQHEGNQGISSAEDSYWASMPGSETAEYKLIFPGATVKEIVIKWKYIAAQYEVSCYMNGYWRSFASKKDNEDQEVKINIGSKFISGIRVLMLKAADDAKFNDKVIYGISSLKVKTGSKAVHLKDCENEGASQLNKWFVDDANFVDIATAPKLIYEFQKLYETSNRLLDLVHKVMLWPPKIQMMVEKAKLLATEIAKIDSEIGSIDLKLQQFKAQNLAEESSGKKDSGLGSLGSSSMRPASSCAYIKQLFPYKMTGYYWIQPDCAKVPIRVFCDYSNSETGIDYVYYGGLGDSVIKNKIKSLNDVKYYCSKLGLYPVELKNKVQILLIQHYLTDIGVNLQSKGFIPMAMDYGCEKQACTGRFSSLSSRTSQDVTEPLTGMIDTQNLLTQDFSKQLNEKPNDLIGFGLSKTGTMTAKFQGGKIPIKGILCSTNNEKGDNTNNWIKADCNTKPRGDNNFDGEINTNIKVICPTGCLSTGSGKVVGTEVFTDDSSVCKAAIHNGALSAEKGGKIEIGILEGKNKYVGSQSFGIKSENLDEKWDRSFVTNQYKVICPIEDFKNRKVTSFLEIIDQNIPINKNLSYLKRKNNRIMNDKDTAFLKIKSAFKTKNTTSFLELYNEIEDEGFPIKNSVTSALNKAKNKASSALSSAQTASSKASETVSNAVSKATDNADATSETASTITSDAAASTTTSESEAGSNSNESQTQKVSSSTNEEIKTGSKLDSTEDAVEKLISLFDLDKDDLTKQVRLIKDTTELLNGLQKEYGPLVNSNLSPDSQSQYTDSLAQHLKGTNIEMGKILSEASSKLKHKQDFKTKLRLEKLKYLKYEPYIEKYDLKLEDIYEIHDFVQASNKPSKWSFSKSALNGHATAIAQTSDIQINGDLKERFASLLKLKYKDFFDGRLTVSLLAKDTGRIGIAFRYLDQFNFYVFEMEKSSSGNTGFKRLRKFVNGEPTVLAIENDGGYLQDKWYRIVIDFSMSKFVVRMEEESEKNLKPDFEDQMTKVIEGYDGDFAEGGFAFLVNSMAGVYFDLFEVKAGKCIDQEKNQDLNIYLPHSCSRFKESFYTDLSFL